MDTGTAAEAAAPHGKDGGVPSALEELMRSTERNVELAHRRAKLIPNGLPSFASPEEAFAFASVEKNLSLYGGVIHGSEHFMVALPSGKRISNWHLSAYFKDLFQPFGIEGYRFLAPHLSHPDLFVQVGAASVLNLPMSRLGYRFHLDDTVEQRRATVEGLQNALQAL